MKRLAVVVVCAVLGVGRLPALSIVPATLTNGIPCVRLEQRSHRVDLLPCEGRMLVYTNAIACTAAPPATVMMPAAVFPTNGMPCALDWTVVCARNGEKAVWLGASDSVVRRRGVAVVTWPVGAPQPVVAVRVPDADGAQARVRQAHAARQRHEDARASKLLRQAAACDPLDPWWRAERQFLEEDAAAAAAALAEGRADPRRTCRDVARRYREIGAREEAEALMRNYDTL